MADRWHLPGRSITDLRDELAKLPDTSPEQVAAATTALNNALEGPQMNAHRIARRADLDRRRASRQAHANPGTPPAKRVRARTVRRANRKGYRHG